MTTRQEAIEDALHTATEVMHAQGEVPTRIIAHTDHALMTFPLSHVMGKDVVKDAAGRAIGAQMRKQDVSVYVFVSEAWMAFAKPGENPYEMPLPSDRPDRIEVLILAASDREGDTFATYKTVRNSRGRFQRFELRNSTELNPDLAIEGRFLGLLRQPVVH